MKTRQAFCGFFLAAFVFATFRCSPPTSAGNGSQTTNAAVAGILVGIYYNQVYPTMGAVPAYKTLALIVVGGLGSVPGAVIASLLLGVAETLLIGYADIPLPRDALAFIAMIGVLMWRSEGLLGSR